jgi:hypothetical protein
MLQSAGCSERRPPLKQRAPSFQFYPRQFAGDEAVMAMDLDAIGAHILLMCATAASPEGYRIATDERAIRNRLRNPSDDDWLRIKTQLLAGPWKLSADGRWWEQHGLRRTLEKQKAFSESQRQKVQSRYSERVPERVPESYQTSTGALPDGLPANYSSSSSSNQSPSPAAFAADAKSSDYEKESGVEPSREAHRLAELLKAHILRNSPSFKFKQAQLRSWAATADQMLRLDGRNVEQISELIAWCQADDFEKCNVLSMRKLRTRFDALELKKRTRSNGRAVPKPTITGNALDYHHDLLNGGGF